MIGEWEVPRIERIQTLESRRLARLSVPGLRGDLHQDLGQHSLVVEITGSLHSDAERGEFLDSVRGPFNAGSPVAFVADITTATELEEVLIEHLDVAERNDHSDAFTYTIRLRQYVEPPEPPTPIDAARCRARRGTRRPRGTGRPRARPAEPARRHPVDR